MDVQPFFSIGRGLYIGHLGGIEIAACEVGEFCSIHQHVKIGWANVTENEKYPRIGSYVWIGPHAKIIGNVTIGDSCTISAGTVVLNDINSCNLVAGNPARIASTVYDNRSLLRLHK
ncbi:MAG: serine O-acetyltransferase [Psychromonas sp.]|jgi:serine O-acetyltransferase